MERISTQPPKKVIRALYDYSAQSKLELRFRKGDFFWVIGMEDDTDWYEACNPSTGARGLVPVPYFEILGKQTTTPTPPGSARGPSSALSPTARSGGSGPSGASMTRYDSVDSRTSNKSSGSSSTTRTKMSMYGIVQYDFKAERPDELSAQAGEAIIVIAQANYEWFVAKPIGRLGGPGLIPVSFCQIRDMQTGQAMTQEEVLDLLINTDRVPKVEEWKRRASEYKNSSISLGKFDDLEGTGPAASHSRSNSSMMRTASSSTADTMSDSRQPHAKTTSTAASTTITSSSAAPRVHVMSVSIPDFDYDDGQYWFHVKATLSNGVHLALCRFYEDFYDFQIAILEEFPAEAGRTGQVRTLPFMPGPLAYVDDSISQQRCTDLDAYLKRLISLQPHISQGSLVNSFFAPRHGDVESSTHAITTRPKPPKRTRKSLNPSRVSDLSQLSLSNTNAQASRKPSSSRRVVDEPRISSRNSAKSERASSPVQHALGRKSSTTLARQIMTGTEQHEASEHEQEENGSSRETSQDDNDDDPTLTGPGAWPEKTGEGTARSSLQTPVAITAHNSTAEKTAEAVSDGDKQQDLPEEVRRPSPDMDQLPPFVKIKIFYRDDVIAIRVPGSVSLADLKLKIQDRFMTKDPIQAIVWMDAAADGAVRAVKTDNDLYEMMISKQKMALYVS